MKQGTIAKSFYITNTFFHEHYPEISDLAESIFSHMSIQNGSIGKQLSGLTVDYLADKGILKDNYEEMISNAFNLISGYIPNENVYLVYFEYPENEESEIFKDIIDNISEICEELFDNGMDAGNDEAEDYIPNNVESLIMIVKNLDMAKADILDDLLEHYINVVENGEEDDETEDEE